LYRLNDPRSFDTTAQRFVATLARSDTAWQVRAGALSFLSYPVWTPESRTLLRTAMADDPDPRVRARSLTALRGISADSGKMILLDGKFERTDNLGILGNACMLEGFKMDGDKMFEVVALVNEQTYQQLNALNPGDQVKLQARCDGRVTRNDGSKYVRLTGAKIAK